MSEVLCLKWNNHKSIFLQNLSNLRTQELYSDATITCNGKYFSVHRLVLSTCSEYFEEIFAKISAQALHPFIIITNIESGYMEALLNFMYNGEVNVLHEMLPGLIKAAEILKIKGLAIPDEDSIERELINVREKEANIITNKEQSIPSSTSASSLAVSQSPTVLATSSRSNSISQGAQMCENIPGYILPDANFSPPVTTICNSIVSVENNAYSSSKGEMMEVCPENHSNNFYSNQENLVSARSDENVKIEEGILASQVNSTQQQHIATPSFPQITPLHPQLVTQPSCATTFSTPVYQPPLPTYTQSSIPLQHDPTMLHNESINAYSTVVPQLHQSFQGVGKETTPKTDYEMGMSNSKCSSWDSTVTPKELESNSTAAAVVQEVIQGLFLPTSDDVLSNDPEEIPLIDKKFQQKTLFPEKEKKNDIRSHLRSKNRTKRERVNITDDNSDISTIQSGNSTITSPKKCPKCSYISKYASTLRRHIMFKHTGEKPHQCNFCSYRTAHNFNMKKHMMIHTGEKPFSCPLCSYKATQNCNIKVHMKSHENKLLRAAIKGSKKMRR